MRIVKLAELLQQPHGTLFSSCESLHFKDLCVYLGPFGVSGKDFSYDSLLGIAFGDPKVLDKAAAAATDPSVDIDIDLYCTSHWGAQDEDETFAIYTAEEQAEFIARLQYALNQRLGADTPQFPPHLITVVSTDADVTEHSANIIKGLFQNAIVIGSTRTED